MGPGPKTDSVWPPRTDLNGESWRRQDSVTARVGPRRLLVRKEWIELEEPGHRVMGKITWSKIRKSEAMEPGEKH